MQVKIIRKCAIFNSDNQQTVTRQRIAIRFNSWTRDNSEVVEDKLDSKAREKLSDDITKNKFIAGLAT